jgi:hypothetical protein
MHDARPTGPARTVGIGWVVAALVVVAAWSALLGYRTVVVLPETWWAAHRALVDSQEQRVERASGLSGAFLAAIRAAVPAGGRLVLYSPYGGAIYELDAADPRGEPARQVRTLFERAKNLLYPHPRDVHYARDAAELGKLVDPQFVGRLCVVDGTQGGGELTVGGRYELLQTQTLGTAMLRLWRLQEAR